MHFLLDGTFKSVRLIGIPATFKISPANPITLQDLVIAFSLVVVLDGIGYILYTRAIRLSTRTREIFHWWHH